MSPIIPENAPKTAAAIAKKTPEIISKIPKIVMPVGLLFHVPRCSILLFIGGISGLPHTGQKFSLDVTSLPQLGQNPNVISYQKLDKRSSILKKETFPKLDKFYAYFYELSLK